MFQNEFKTESEEQTLELGRSFAEKLEFGDTVAFYGDIGAGKTEFIKGICSFFEVQDLVSSPTFSIINKYTGNRLGVDFPIYHIDLYRIKEKDELHDIGFEECMFGNDSIKLVEWSENSKDLLPENKYIVTIETENDSLNIRNIKISNLLLEPAK